MVAHDYINDFLGKYKDSDEVIFDTDINNYDEDSDDDVADPTYEPVEEPSKLCYFY